MEKKCSMSLLLWLLCFVSHSQVQKLSVNLNGKIFKSPDKETIRFQGTPYTQTKFAYAEIENIEPKHFMRYNAHADNFEFITFKNDTLALDNPDNFKTITFTNPRKKYTRVNYISPTLGRVRGYLVELYSQAGIVLYKKEMVTFYEGKKARNSLETDIPARYSSVVESYFFSTKTGNIISFPENKGQLIRLYPGKKSEINAFVKENRIDFNLEADRVKIINFLAQ